MPLLTTKSINPQFDLEPWVGQRSATFRFTRSNGATGEKLGIINPLRNASLSHDTTRTIKRQLTLNLGVRDSALINPVSDRIDLDMITGDGTVWPLGRYIFTDDTSVVTTSGELSNVVLNDEMFKVDQEIVEGINATQNTVGIVVQNLMLELQLEAIVDASPYTSGQAWGTGTTRGQILEALAVIGDYFSPWFGNDKKFHMIRTFDPAMAIPQFNFDAGNQVVRNSITKSSNLLTAPNRFVVISNTEANNFPLVGVATVPDTAPNSFTNRGFYITNTQTLPLTELGQATAVAAGLANRQTIFETVTLSTPPDPRHDSYDVIFWQGDLWLELAWTMQLIEGGKMSHTMRKAYKP